MSVRSRATCYIDRLGRMIDSGVWEVGVHGRPDPLWRRSESASAGRFSPPTIGRPACPWALPDDPFGSPRRV